MLQGSPAEKRDLFSGSSASRFGEAGLRIPLDKLGAAVSPTSEPRKDNVLPPVAAENTSCPSPECSQFDDLNSN